MDDNIQNEEKSVRGGTGNKGNPIEIKRAITEATKDLKRAGNDVEKITHDKEELLRDLADLRVHENEEVPSVIRKTIEKSIRAVQKKLKEINGALPEVDLPIKKRFIKSLLNGKRVKKYSTMHGEHLRAQNTNLQLTPLTKGQWVTRTAPKRLSTTPTKS